MRSTGCLRMMREPLSSQLAPPYRLDALRGALAQPLTHRQAALVTGDAAVSDGEVFDRDGAGHGLPACSCDLVEALSAGELGVSEWSVLIPLGVSPFQALEFLDFLLKSGFALCLGRTPLTGSSAGE